MARFRAGIFFSRNAAAYVNPGQRPGLLRCGTLLATNGDGLGRPFRAREIMGTMNLGRCPRLTWTAPLALETGPLVR